VVQIFVAAAGLFTMAHQLDNNQSYTVSDWNNNAYWIIHFFNALASAVVILLMLGAAFLARLSARAKRQTGVLVGLLVLQAILGFIPWPAPISALHVLNAFAMLGVAGDLVRRNWAFGRRAA
jgi:heme A synthase